MLKKERKIDKVSNAVIGDFPIYKSLDDGGKILPVGESTKNEILIEDQGVPFDDEESETKKAKDKKNPKNHQGEILEEDFGLSFDYQGESEKKKGNENVQSSNSKSEILEENLGLPFDDSQGKVKSS